MRPATWKIKSPMWTNFQGNVNSREVRQKSALLAIRKKVGSEPSWGMDFHQEMLHNCLMSFSVKKAICFAHYVCTIMKPTRRKSCNLWFNKSVTVKLCSWGLSHQVKSWMYLILIVFILHKPLWWHRLKAINKKQLDIWCN